MTQRNAVHASGAGASLGTLSEAQRRAVEHRGGPLLVLSGPGTGKTRVITHRIAHLIQHDGVSPESVLALTYTVKAARQMRERLAELIGSKAEGVRALTIHGFGWRLIRRFGRMGRTGRGETGAGIDGAGASIIDSAQRARTIRSIIKDHGLFRAQMPLGVQTLVEQTIRVMDVLGDSAISTDDAIRHVERVRAALAQGQDATGATLDDVGIRGERARLEMFEQTVRVIEHFERVCRERGWMTFGHMVTMPIRILDASANAAAIVRDECRHVVVDEFQDVNVAQIELLRRICPATGAPDLCAVGDDDQSIYEFRGADDQAFARFASIWTSHTTVRLEENYRSRPEIIQTANSIMSRAIRRFDAAKRILAARPAGGDALEVECVQTSDDRQYPELIAAMILLDRKRNPGKKWADFAVIGRSHADLDRTLATLRIEGIPAVAMRSDSPLDDPGVQDVLAWVDVLVNPTSAYAAVRLLTRPPMSVALAEVAPLQQRYRAAQARFEQQAAGASDPGGFADWLARTAPDAPGVKRFLERHDALRAETAQAPAADAIQLIITRTDPAHADLVGVRKRAERVQALVTLLRFVRERQVRLEAPGDLAAFLAYFNDLSDRERELRDVDLAERVDGADKDEEDLPDGVRLITAHSAKGLEFDTVFVPHISPRSGYGRTGQDDDPDVPAGLLRVQTDVPDRDRRLAEERRIFYVACTRAERRLVLMAKKNKGRSKSVHLFEEIVHDSTLKGVLRITAGDDVLQQAGEAGVWKVGSRTPLDAERALMRIVPARREVFDAARRDVRLSAAAALDAAGSGDAEPTGSILALGEAVRMLAAIDHAERTGVAPEWSVRQGGAVLERVRSVLARAQALEAHDQGADAPGVHMPPPRGPLTLSYSHIDQYVRCPRCYYVRYVLDLGSKGSAAQSIGETAHRALQAFYEEVRAAESDGRTAPGVDRLREIARIGFHASLPESVVPDELALRQLLSQMDTLHERLHDPGANVLELERWISFAYGQHTLNAKIDRIDQITLPGGATGFAIIDYKTGNASLKLREPEPDDLQMGIYAMALASDQGLPAGELPKGRAEYWLLSSGERGVIDLASLRMDRIHAQIDRAISGILSGQWPRKGGDWGGPHDCDILGPA